MTIKEVIKELEDIKIEDEFTKTAINIAIETMKAQEAINDEIIKEMKDIGPYCMSDFRIGVWTGLHKAQDIVYDYLIKIRGMGRVAK